MSKFSNFFTRNKELSLKEQQEEEINKINAEQHDNDLNLDEKINAYRNSLGFLARKSFKPTLSMYYEIGTKPKEVNSTTKLLYLSSSLFAVIGFFGAYKVSHLSLLVSLMIAVVAILGVYFAFSNNLKQKYTKVHTIKQQNFNNFTRLILPYLEEIKKGEHMYNIFSKVTVKITNPEANNLLTRLMAEMTQSPNKREPFKRFARDMSGTNLSQMFMDSLFDMTQGSYSTSTVHDLAKMNDKLYLTITKQVKKDKLKQLDHIFPFFFGWAVAIIFVFLILLVKAEMSQMMMK